MKVTKKMLGCMMILSMALTQVSCQSRQKQIITEKITYDVPIRNTDPQVDWWVRNLPGPARDQLIEYIFEEVRAGRLAAYSETGIRLTEQEIKNIGREELNMRLPNPDPPYTPKDTTIIQELDLRDITRIRFLETWFYDPSGSLIKKKINGMAPVMENYGPDGELRGYEALFWVYQEGYKPE